MNRRAAASAGRADPRVGEAVSAALTAGGSAVDAVVAGVLCAAGLDPAVLLSPMVMLVAGSGAGARAFDGRAAQPGRGAPRPRGFVADAEIPAAAHVAAPRSVAMLILAHGRFGRLPLRELVKAGVEAAAASAAPGRKALLKAIGTSGVTALRGEDVLRPLVALGGPVAGGLLTAEDIRMAVPDDAPASHAAFHPFPSSVATGGELMLPPWPHGDPGPVETLLACDGRNLAAALAYAPVPASPMAEELGVALPLGAVPVARGVTRVPPGTALPMPAYVAIAVGLEIAALAPIGADIDPAALAGSTDPRVLADGDTLRAALGAAFAHAVVQDDRAARVVR